MCVTRVVGSHECEIALRCSILTSFLFSQCFNIVYTFVRSHHVQNKRMIILIIIMPTPKYYGVVERGKRCPFFILYKIVWDEMILDARKIFSGIVWCIILLCSYFFTLPLCKIIHSAKNWRMPDQAWIPLSGSIVYGNHCGVNLDTRRVKFDTFKIISISFHFLLSSLWY